MTLPSPIPALAPRSDRLRSAAARLMIPSVGSVMFHGTVAIIVLMLAQSPSCRKEMSRGDGDSFREVGIYRGDPNLPPGESGVTGEISSQPIPALETYTTPRIAEPTLDLSAVPLNLPESVGASSPVIGPGLQFPSVSTLGDEFLRPAAAGTGGLGSSGTGSGGGGGTSFLGIHDVGTRFVFVIDRSASMATDEAFAAAKRELEWSLAQLTETQQFQVIFYNNRPHALQPRNSRSNLFWATDAQRLVVSEQMQSILPAEGTDHLPALMMALEYNPDVIYLLTDGAAESALKAADFQKLAQRNRQGSRIHCIEFGRGVKSPSGDAGNFLKQLAQRNNGQYIYRNVSSR